MPPIDDDNFIVEAIIGECHIDGEKQYLVKWLGYPNEENTWEPYSHVEDNEALDKWMNRLQANAITAKAAIMDIGMPEPSTYKDAISGPEAPQWQQAIDDELKSLNLNNAWDIVP